MCIYIHIHIYSRVRPHVRVSAGVQQGDQAREMSMRVGLLAVRRRMHGLQVHT